MKHSVQLILFYSAFVPASFLGCPQAAAADESAAEGDTADEAALHFKQGIEFYKQQKYEAASIEFGRAYELKPSYKILYNVGQVENTLEHYAAALTAYRSYLNQGGDEIPPDRRNFIEEEVARLVTRVGYIAVKSGNDGAAVLIDGEERGRLPLHTAIAVDIGKREVEILANTTRLFRQIYPVAGGQQIVINLSDDAPPDATANNDNAGPVLDDSPDGKSDGTGSVVKIEDRKPKKVVGAILLSTGIAVGAAGAVTGGIATSKRKHIEASCSNSLCYADEWSDEFNTVKKLSISTDILIGLGAASATAGLILLLVNPKSETSKVTAGVGPTQNGAFAVVTGRF